MKPSPVRNADWFFRELILKSVGSALDAALGSSLKRVTLHTLKRQFNLQTEDFVTRPEEFRTALQSLFGNEGARHIEDRIMQWFYTSIGQEYKPTRTTLSRKVSKAKKDYDKASRVLRKSS
jgi:hypothetical protein